MATLAGGQVPVAIDARLLVLDEPTLGLDAASVARLGGALADPTADLTVFAPTDAAFQALPPGELDKLMLPENRAQLQKLLTLNSITSGAFRGSEVGRAAPDGRRRRHR